MSETDEEEKRILQVLQTGDIGTVLIMKKTSLVEVCQKLDIEQEGNASELKVRIIHYYTNVKPHGTPRVVEVGFNREYQQFIAEILENVRTSTLTMHESMKIQSLDLKAIAESTTKKGAGFIKIKPYKHGDDDLDNYLSRFETLCEHLGIPMHKRSLELSTHLKG